MIYYLDLLGTLVFAISGTITGIDRKLDLFGAGLVGFVTAVGGGTLRDVLMGSHPVGWMMDLNYFWSCLMGILVTFFFLKRFRHWHRALFLFDALGIGVFTLLGLEKALDFNLHPVLSVLMGMTSAVFGGVLRDMLCSQVPLILRKEIYATLCIFGGFLYLAATHYFGQHGLIMIFCILVIFLLRIIVVKYSWQLPSLNLN